MKWNCLLMLSVLLMVEGLHAVPSAPYETEFSLAVRSNDETKEHSIVREKRAPLGKLALLGGAALVGKKALLLGGAAVGAKALIGAGILGAGLYKAKYYGGNYDAGYANQHSQWYR